MTILVPLFNERPRIEESIARWRDSGLLDAFRWVVVDDGSSDGTPSLVAQLLAGHQNVHILRLEQHASKYCALAHGLAHVSTPLVLCLDADTWFDDALDLLRAECDCLLAEERDVVSFRIDSFLESSSLVSRLQAAEYAFFTDVTRRRFAYVGNVNGPAALWRSEMLRRVLPLHSLCFEGDDLESTVLLHRLGAVVTASSLAFRTKPKPSLLRLAVQRISIWDVGLFRTLFECPPLRVSPSADTVFLQWYFIFEGLLHPLKIISLVLYLWKRIDSSVSIHVVSILQLSILGIYTLALLVSSWLWLSCVRRIPRTVTMLPLLILLFVYPTFHWLGDLSAVGFVVYLSSWIGIAGVHALNIRNSRLRGFALTYCWLLPFYFLFLAVVLRTIGWFVWLTRAFWSRRQPSPSLRTRALAAVFRS